MLKRIVNFFIYNTVSYPKSNIFIFFFLSFISLNFFLNNIKINTSTESLISEKSEFRKKQNELRKLYPYLSNNNIIVLKSQNDERLKSLTKDILAKFQETSDNFNFFFCPQIDNFFKKNAFKLLNERSRDDILEKIYKFQPFLTEINNNPKLFGFNNLFEQAINNKADISFFLETLKKMNSSINNAEKINWKNEFNNTNEIFIIFGFTQDYLDKNNFSDFYVFLNEIKKNNSDIKINFTGSQILDYEELSSVTKGALKASLLSIILVGTLLWIAFRNVFFIASLIITIFVGLSITLGIVAFTVGSLNIISIAFAVLFIGISVDFGIQLSLRLREIKTYTTNNVISSVKDISRSIIIVGTTSIIGFLSFVPTEYIGLSELGLVSTIGVLVGLVTNIFFLPSLLLSFNAFKNQKKTLLFNSNLISLINFFFKKKIVTIYFFIFILIVSLFSYKNINFDSDPLKLKDQESQSVKLALKLLDKDPSSDYKISVFSKDFSKEKIDAINNILEVESVFSIENLYKIEMLDEDLIHLKFLLDPKNNSQFYSNIDEFKRLKNLLKSLENHNYDLSNKIPEYLFQNLDKLEEDQLNSTEELWFSDFSKLVDNINYFINLEPINENEIPDYYLKRYVSENDLKRIEIYPNEITLQKNNLSEFVNNVLKVYPNATGMPIIQKEAGRVVIKSFITALIITLSILSVFCYIIFKSYKYLILSFLPIFISVPITMLFMTILSMDLNFANMIALPLIFSLGMSYTIFILKRYRSNNSYKKLMESSTPNAVIFSGLTTIGSFSTLALSNHSGTSSMGVLLFLSLLITLFNCLVVLPFIIKSLEKKLQ